MCEIQHEIMEVHDNGLLGHAVYVFWKPPAKRQGCPSLLNMVPNCSKYAIVAKNYENLDDARVLVKVFYVRNVRSQQSIPSERTRAITRST